ncbi:MAG: hypothetical protein II030_02970 [Treponema sp.]|nr:hypothetical protein [Treponema sp.]
MKKITLVAGLLLSALVLFGAMGCSSGGGGGGSDDDGVSYSSSSGSSGSGSGSSSSSGSGSSGTRTYTSVAGGTFKQVVQSGQGYLLLTFNDNGTFESTSSLGAGGLGNGKWRLDGNKILLNLTATEYTEGIYVHQFTANSTFTQLTQAGANIKYNRL